MMKGPLLTHVEKSSSDPRWEESMKLQLQADPSFPTHRAYTSPQGCVQRPKPACGLVLTTSSLQWVLRLCASSHVEGRTHSCQLPQKQSSTLLPWPYSKERQWLYLVSGTIQ